MTELDGRAPAGAPELRLRAAGAGLLALPWAEPLDSWSPDEVALRDVPVGPSRHLVKFVEADGKLYALKEEPVRIARKEYTVLRTLQEHGLPAVRPVGLVEQPIEDNAILVTEFLERSWQFRRLFMRLPPDLAKHRHRLFDAMATLLVELHRHGVFWGDCSLANTLFKRDGQRLQAHLVDAETSEIQPSLSAARRDHDLEIMVENVALGLVDVAIRLGRDPDETDDLLADALSVRQRYTELWNELTTEQTLRFDQRHEVGRRIQRLNDLGFAVDEVRLLPTGSGSDEVRLQVTVAGRDFHATQLRAATGLQVGEGQATILLADLHSFTYSLKCSAGRDVDDLEAAHLWLRNVFRPGLAKVADAFPDGDPIQTYCDLLEVRWLLSEQERRDVGDEAAIAAMRARVVPPESAAKLAVVDAPTGTLPALTAEALARYDEP